MWLIYDFKIFYVLSYVIRQSVAGELTNKWTYRYVDFIIL